MDEDVTLTSISADSELMFFEQDGEQDKASYSFFRGSSGRFHPTDRSIQSHRALRYFFDGLTPSVPFLDPTSSIVTFGSCFAGHIADHLDRIGYNVANKRHKAAYVASMGEGIVNSFAIRQQFEWAWEAKQPKTDLWHDYDANALGYDETARLDTKAMFDGADLFIVTLGLSEVWFDEPTGEVFWRTVPAHSFDPTRHKFRVATFDENLRNLRDIHRLIRAHRSAASIVFTLSPIPLKATFRPIPCVSANWASKAVLRAALDQLLTDVSADRDTFYFPSFEVALGGFAHPFMEDRRHIHKHVLDFNMTAFERYYCATGLDDRALREKYRSARALDREVVTYGHWAVPRANLLFHKPPPGAKVVPPAAA